MKVNVMATKVDGMEYVIVRTESAGVFAGYCESRVGSEIVLKKARRLWYWKGVATLSQLAVDGVNCPKECMFPIEVNTIILLGVIEIIPCTKKAQDSIKGVPIWQI